MDEFFARNRLSAYLDGELPSAEAREVEDALARSPELRAELDDLRGMVTLLRSGGRVPAPKGFAARLDARLEREPAALGWRRHLRGVRIEAVMLAAAAAVVLVFAAHKPDEPAEAPVAAAEPAAPQVDAAGVPVGSKGVGAPGPASTTSAEPEAPSKEVSALPNTRPATPRAAPKTTGPTTRIGQAQGVEKEAYTPAWEQQDDAPSVYAAAPFQYRLKPQSDAGLRELAALAASLGGSLADARGKPLAPYPMESGEVRTVRLMLPTMNAGDVARRLTELGALEIVNTQSDRTMYAQGAMVPVVIEVTQP
jgi:hypothetical protein